MKCSNCNNNITENDKFCEKCGQEVIKTNYTKQNKKNNSNVIIMAIVVILASSTGYFFAKSNMLENNVGMENNDGKVESSEEKIAESVELDTTEEKVAETVEPDTTEEKVAETVEPDTTEEKVAEIIEPDSNVAEEKVAKEIMFETNDEEKIAEEFELVTNISSQNQDDYLYNEPFKEIFVNYITSSSTLPREGNYTYFPENAIDGNVNTAWIEGANGIGVNEWLECYFSQEELVKEIHIYNGYGGNYAENSIASRYEIFFSNGESRSFSVNGMWNTLTLDQPIKTSSVRIAIAAGSTSKYLDTGISEVMFYNK